MVLMIVGLAVAALIGIVVVWLLITRGSRAVETSRADFDREYDRLVAEGEAVEDQREAAWRGFHGWQADDERERLEWKEAPDE